MGRQLLHRMGIVTRHVANGSSGHHVRCDRIFRFLRSRKGASNLLCLWRLCLRHVLRIPKPQDFSNTWYVSTPIGGRYRRFRMVVQQQSEPNLDNISERSLRAPKRQPEADVLQAETRSSLN